ncbi:MAG: branched-chain amino acid transaminase [Bacteroidetes bacterium]|nr:branched-chain amino acid transaminase [Bacteroidota bacterium]MCY4205682.1 branched-chain amino acid transaminase [Bacteroidota bacterium]
MKYDIWFNGKFVPHEDAKVHVLSHAIHYGSSVFEGIRAYDTKKGVAIYRLGEHIRRLLDSAKIYRMQSPYDQEIIEQASIEIISRSKLKASYIRPILFRGEGPMGVNPLDNPVETAIAAFPWGPYLGEDSFEQGVDVQVSSWNRFAPNTLPALAKAGGNYLNASLVKMEALLNGYIEGIMLTTSGYLAEGSGENLFIVRDGTLYTAPTSFSILPGITRSSVIKLAEIADIPVQEGSVPREALYLADELFFTGTAAEITPIRSVDKYVVGDGKRGPVTKKLQEMFLDIVEEGNDPFKWLTYVGQ